MYVPASLKTLIVVRHGRTRGNEAMRAARAGNPLPYSEEVISEIMNTHSMNERLVPEGKVQIQNVGKWIYRHYDQTHYGPLLSYRVSPFPRAIESAIALDLPNAQWQINPELRERDHGLFDRKTPQQTLDLFPEYVNRKNQNRWVFAPPGGESNASVYLRLALWLQSLSGNVLAVSHYDTMSVLIMMLTGMSIQQYHESQETKKDSTLEIPNGAILFFEFSTAMRYRKITEVDHLQNAVESNWQTLRLPSYSNNELEDYLRAHYPN